jgi:hypothetical protein
MTGVDPVSGAPTTAFDYDEIVTALKKAGHSPQEIARALRMMQSGQGILPSFRGQAAELAQLRTLLFNVEVQRDRRNVLFSAMGVDLMSRGAVSGEQLLSRERGAGLHPATPTGAAAGFTNPGTFVPRGTFARVGGRRGIRAARAENRQRQIKLLKTWFRAQVAAGNEPEGKSAEQLRAFVRAWVERYYGLAERSSAGDK